MIGTVEYYKTAFMLLLFGVWNINLCAQDMQWHDPMEENNHVIHGQGWKNTGYARLPDEAKSQVRDPVWNLSKNSAGLVVRFVTDAPKIEASYIPQERLQMPHMPATGVSGLDLYTKDDTGNWVWVRGNYSFGDTVKYSFSLKDDVHSPREFHLYLPLYNSVDNLRIGVDKDKAFEFVPTGEKQKPITIYGTSIVQGGCASRPGMAWTSILSRQLNTPIVNLGFSGNGQLEEPIIRYLAEIESALYVLDCLPNLVREEFVEEEVKSRLRFAVKHLKEQQPDVPVLMVEHAGYTDGLVDKERAAAYGRLNEWCKSVYRELVMEGIEEIYLLEKEAIGLTLDATVDGTHPTDLGMQQYADAVAEMTKEIF